MELLIIIGGVFFIGYWLIKNIVLALFGASEKEDKGYVDRSTTIIHNHYTNNHLHIDKEDAQKLKK